MFRGGRKGKPLARGRGCGEGSVHHGLEVLEAPSACGWRVGAGSQQRLHGTQGADEQQAPTSGPGTQGSNDRKVRDI